MWLNKVKTLISSVEIERIRVECHQILGSDVQISVSEINCPEPDCPPVKTVIMVFRKDAPTQSFTVHKPCARVTAYDINVAVRADT